MLLPSFFPAGLILWKCGSGRGEELAGKSVLRLIQIRLVTSIFGQNSLARQVNSPQITNRRLEFQKRGQLFVCTRNETLSVVAMRVCNPDCSPAEINR
jgi:hypothetical protein